MGGGRKWVWGEEGEAEGLNARARARERERETDKRGEVGREGSLVGESKGIGQEGTRRGSEGKAREAAVQRRSSAERMPRERGRGTGWRRKKGEREGGESAPHRAGCDDRRD
eukprot:scaffold147909_cov31-Tisochrysis_lutea.AAC.1